MVRAFVLLVAVVAAVQTVFPQDEAGWERQTQVSLEFGYFSPAKESFRTNYDQKFAFGSAGIPLSVGVEIDRPLSRTVDLFLNIRRVNNRLKSNDDFSLVLMPATAGIRYLVLSGGSIRSAWTPFFQAGLELYWTRFAVDYSFTRDVPYALAIIDDSQDYFGYGLSMGLGVEHPFGEFVSGSLGVNYDLNRLGSSGTGRLGNVGGILIAAKIGFNI